MGGQGEGAQDGARVAQVTGGQDGARVARVTGGQQSANGGAWMPAEGRPVEARRWLAGPEADPLRELPWFVRAAGKRRRRKTRPLPRPRRFKRTTFWMRLRNSIVLVGLALVVWLCGVGAVTLAAQVRGLLPSTGRPTPVATHIASPAAAHTPGVHR
jgi:hypothetical protein